MTKNNTEPKREFSSEEISLMVKNHELWLKDNKQGE